MATSPESNETPGWVDAAEWADYYWHQYKNAGSLAEQNTAFERLSNHMHDLRTWLPGYEYEHDTLPWQREDEDDSQP